MNLKNNLRRFFINFLKKEWIDYIRYFQFSTKIKNLHKSKEIHEFFEPEMEILPKLLKKKFNLGIDIGANYGSYAFVLSKIGNENTRIFSFEPIPRSYKILARVIKKFNLKNVKPINMALGNEEGYINMAIPNNITGLAHICSKKEKSEGKIQKVKIGKLDNFINKLNKKVDFIKCDVEGKELDVFKGAYKTIKNSKPIILCEIEQRHTDRYGIDVEEVNYFLSKMGYKLFFYRNKKLIGVEHILKDKANYFFIHKSKIKSINPILFN